MTRVPLWIGLALPLLACATEVGGGSPGSGGTQAGGGQTGAAGTTGGAGTTGAAGATGTAGSSGAAGAAGRGGAGGAAGTTGTAGRGGTTGAAGSAAGRGGTTGSAGTTGTAGTTGAGGSGAAPVNLAGRKALLVVDNPGSLDSGENILKLTLEGRDMIVTVAPSTGPASLATGQNVVVVSSSAGSGDFVPIYKDVAVPMIVFGNSAYSNLGWITGSSGKGTVNSMTLASLVDATTPLASDLMTGVGFKMILDSRSTSLYWGTPAASAIRTASIMGQSAQLVSFAYEKNAALMTGTAAARRVGFGVKTDSVQDLTIEGFKLLMAAVEWTAGGN